VTSTSREAAAQRFLLDQGLQAAGEQASWTPLDGGVSSDLWRVDLRGRTLCVKAALPRLRVADEWYAPVERNAVEYAWLLFAGQQRPGCVPRLLGHDPDAGFFAMEFLPPATAPSWKSELMAGRVDPVLAGQVGDVIGQIHAVSATDPHVPEAFATDGNFAALRIEPYFHVTARRNPSVADRLRELAERTASTRVALVHGDLSPKNILAGPHGPVILDAECAWFGDPAFDLAFCLTHLLLKSVVRPDRAEQLQDSAYALVTGHIAHLSWEPSPGFEKRVAALLPALLLARVDGASPVEYLVEEVDQARVRAAAMGLLTTPAGAIVEALGRLAGMLSSQRGANP
jgi:aminoglycoside phosphotransferase (APT) family kinase protein